MTDEDDSEIVIRAVPPKDMSRAQRIRLARVMVDLLKNRALPLRPGPSRRARIGTRSKSRRHVVSECRTSASVTDSEQITVRSQVSRSSTSP